MDKKWIYIGLGALAVIAIGGFAVHKIRLRRGNSRQGDKPNKDDADAPIPTITSAQAIAVANGVQQAIDDCGYGSSLDDVKTVLAPIKNQADFDLVKAAFGTRDLDACTWSTQSDTKTDLVSGLYWEYSEPEEINNLKAFLSAKGVAI
jgi:hypothetical protein